MSTGACLGVFGVLGKQLQAFFGSGDIDAAMFCVERVVDRDRAGLARRIRNACGQLAVGVDQLQLGDMGDGGSCLRLSAKAMVCSRWSL
jgi:hypothetical protein